SANAEKSGNIRTFDKSVRDDIVGRLTKCSLPTANQLPDARKNSFTHIPTTTATRAAGTSLSFFSSGIFSHEIRIASDNNVMIVAPKWIWLKTSKRDEMVLLPSA